MQRILVADVETTGLDCKSDEIVELSFVEVDELLNVVSKLSTKINPQRKICPAASAVHGIIDSDVAEAPSLTGVLHPYGEDYFEDVFLIAHNARFDQGFLNKCWNIQGVFCTLRAAKKMYPGAPNHKLQTLRYYLELDVDREAAAHSAEGDVLALLALLKRMLIDSQQDLSTFVDLMSEPILFDVMPFGKYKGCALKSLPRTYTTWLLNLPDLDEDLKASILNL